MESLTQDALLNAGTNEPLSIVKLQVIASFLMTIFNETPNPKISHLIVRHFHLLIVHPDVAQFPDCTESYLRLKRQWQRTTEMLLEQRKSDKPTYQHMH